MSIVIRRAEYCDLESITNIHIEIFEDYFLTQLGFKLLYFYYLEYFLQNNILLIAEDNCCPIGFLVGYYTDRPNARNIFTKHHFLRLCFKLFYLVLKKDEGAIRRIKARINGLFTRKKINNNNANEIKPFADVLSIGVIDKYKRCGVGKKLLVEFENCIKKNNKCKTNIIYTLSTFSNNSRAINFCLKNGLTITKSNDVEVYFRKTLNHSNKCELPEFFLLKISSDYL